MHRTTKTSMISFRIAKQLKKRLENAALRERRTLSSVIVGILQDSLDSREDNTPLGVSTLTAKAYSLSKTCRFHH